MNSEQCAQGMTSKLPMLPGDPESMYHVLEGRSQELSGLIEELEGQLQRAYLERSMVIAAQERFNDKQNAVVSPRETF